MGEDQYIAGGDGRGTVGTRTNNFSYQKFDFGTYRHDLVFRIYQHHHIDPPPPLQRCAPGSTGGGGG